MNEKARKPKRVPKRAPPGGEAITAGTYVVGEDIRPGTYKARANDWGCYWARLTRGNDIIDNHFGEGRAVVTIQPVDYAFETSGCTR